MSEIVKELATTPLRQFKPYPAYKDSGVEWLGQIPAHWDVKPFKALLTRNDSGVWGEDALDEGSIVLRSTEQAVDGKWVIEGPARRLLTQREAAETRLEVGDLVVTKSSGSEQHIGKTSIVDDTVAALRCGFSNFMQRLRVHPSYDARYFWYLLNNPVAREQLIFLSSTTTGLGNLNRSIFGAIRVPAAPPDEQRAIAYFLDRETERVDALVTEKERLIELLQEKCDCLIATSVTRGLNPSVPMKNSGVGWLGKIPEHWKIQRIKHVLRWMIDTEHKTAPFYLDGKYLVVRTSNVKSGRLALADAKFTDRDAYDAWTRRGRPEPGDILFTREAPAGEACLVPDSPPVCLGQRMVLFKIDRRLLDGRFGVYALYGGLAAEFVEFLSQGSTVAHFNMADIGNIPIVVPPVNEQAVIADFIDHKTAELEQLLARVQDGLQRLTEFRMALVAAAVTGKIDVRNELA